MRTIQQGAFRILDANLHRATEGLRVLMDVARFACDDKDVSERLKMLRHRLFGAIEQIPGYYSKARDARESEKDVGREAAVGAKGFRKDICDIYRANLHRSQEALRVLEETGKLFSPQLGAELESLRFILYQVDKEFQPKVEKLRASGLMDFELYLVTGRTLSLNRDFLDVVEAAILGGVGAVQLREKHWSKREILAVAKDLRALTRERNVTFFLNDHLDVALACEADGCHLGQDDFPVEEARRIVGPDFVLGLSTHNLEQALEAESLGPTYINVGPIFHTNTKETGCNPVGPELITKVKQSVQIPQTCMGGINSANVHQVISAGAERVAVVSAIVAAVDIEVASRDILNRIHKAKEQRGN